MLFIREFISKIVDFFVELTWKKILKYILFLILLVIAWFALWIVLKFIFGTVIFAPLHWVWVKIGALGQFLVVWFGLCAIGAFLHNISS